MSNPVKQTTYMKLTYHIINYNVVMDVYVSGNAGSSRRIVRPVFEWYWLVNQQLRASNVPVFIVHYKSNQYLCILSVMRTLIYLLYFALSICFLWIWMSDKLQLSTIYKKEITLLKQVSNVDSGVGPITTNGEIKHCICVSLFCLCIYFSY